MTYVSFCSANTPQFALGPSVTLHSCGIKLLEWTVLCVWSVVTLNIKQCTQYVHDILHSCVKSITLSAVAPDYFYGWRRLWHTFDTVIYTTDCKSKPTTASIGTAKCFIFHLWSCRTVLGDYASHVVCLVSWWWFNVAALMKWFMAPIMCRSKPDAITNKKLHGRRVDNKLIERAL